jgi:LAO/AO transport system kinase
VSLPDIDELALGVLAGNRRSLARAITLVESTRDDHRRLAEALLDRVLPQTGNSTRIGISGTPGVGKSTFIERFGLLRVDAGHRVAVLAIDPTSVRTGGSILGDKTRMPDLSRSSAAYIRPSPAGGSLGGIAMQTREVMLLCEAAGFDTIIVETVGVGQSETAVADVTDLFVLLLAPGGGDELQGIKRGVMELADVVVVNKADGELTSAANHTAADYRHALHLVRPKWSGYPTEVLTCSALHGTGVEATWDHLIALRDRLVASGHLEQLRADQAVTAFWASVRHRLIAHITTGTQLSDQLVEQVRAGTRSPSSAARTLIESRP